MNKSYGKKRKTIYSLYTTLFFAILVGSSFTGNVNACDQIGSSNNILNA